MSNNVRKQHIGNLPVGFWRETAVCRSLSFSRWCRPRTGLVWLRSHRTRDYSRCARPSYLSNSTKRRKHSCRMRTTRVCGSAGGGGWGEVKSVGYPGGIPYPLPDTPLDTLPYPLDILPQRDPTPRYPTHPYILHPSGYPTPPPRYPTHRGILYPPGYPDACETKWRI